MSKDCSILKIEKLVAGELSDQEKDEIIAHIRGCKECSTLFNTLSYEKDEFLRIYPFETFELNYKKLKSQKQQETSKFFIFNPSFAYAFLVVIAVMGIFSLYNNLHIRKIPNEIIFKGEEISSVNIGSLTKTKGRRYAFIVGQNNGGESVTPLRYAEKDASELATILNKYGGFRKEDIRIFLDIDSLQMVKNISKFINDIKDNLKKEKAFFLFYYTGHADRKGFLLKNTHFSFTILKEMIKNISENGGLVISIIDACQSGVMVAFKGETIEENLFFDDKLGEPEGEIWITSSSANERSQESENLQSSIFSFFFFTGLKGSADISGDRRVSLIEAYQYAYRKTLETSTMTSGILQHPLYKFNIVGNGEIILTDMSSSKGGVLIDSSCSGSFLVLSEDYTTLYADFRKKVGSEVFIALPVGEYVVINAKSDGGTNIGFYKFNVTSEKNIVCSIDSLKPSLYETVKKFRS